MGTQAHFNAPHLHSNQGDSETQHQTDTFIASQKNVGFHYGCGCICEWVRFDVFWHTGVLSPIPFNPTYGPAKYRPSGENAISRTLPRPNRVIAPSGSAHGVTPVSSGSNGVFARIFLFSIKAPCRMLAIYASQAPVYAYSRGEITSHYT